MPAVSICAVMWSFLLRLKGGEQAPDVPGCSSCGIPLNQVELDHAEQYEDRCGNCQRLYEDKSYCPVCNKVSLTVHILSSNKRKHISYRLGMHVSHSHIVSSMHVAGIHLQACFAHTAFATNNT